MASRALAAAARAVRTTTAACSTPCSRPRRGPVILHWLGDDVRPRARRLLGLRPTSTAATDGVTRADRRPRRARSTASSCRCSTTSVELRLRDALPEGVRLYTGDDFNYPALIAGGSDALLGIFDAIAPAASAALQALDAGDAGALRRAARAHRCRWRASCSPRPPTTTRRASSSSPGSTATRSHFRMVAGLESARTLVHLADALPAGRRRRPARRSRRWPPSACGRLLAAGRGRSVSIDPARLSLQPDHRRPPRPRSSVVEACAGAGIGWLAPWRHKLVPGCRRRASASAGLRVSSLCRGGFFPAAGRRRPARARRGQPRCRRRGGRARRADVLVLVCGPAPDGDLGGARAAGAGGHRGAHSPTPPSTACGSASSRCTR